jgi:hypothetical protein
MVENAQGLDVHLGEDPRAYAAMGSLEFAKKLLPKAIGFGEYGVRL